MSTSADVENAILTLLGAAFYDAEPTGLVNSAAGMPIKLHRGWPQMEELNADVRAQPARAHIAVNRYPGMARNVTRYPDSWSSPEVTVPAVAGVVEGNRVTFSGTASGAQLVGIGIGDQGYAVSLAPGATAASAAAALASEINAYSDAVATTDGDTLVLEAPQGKTLGTVIARNACIVTAFREVARVQAGFLVSVFAGSIEDRDAIEAIALPALCAPTALSLSDGGFPLVPVRTIQNDLAENADVYRVDWVFSTEYGISQAMQAAGMMFFGMEVRTSEGDLIRRSGQFYPGT